VERIQQRKARDEEIARAICSMVGKDQPGGEREGNNLMSKKKDAIEVEGTVIEPLPNAMFRVELKTDIRCWPMFREKFV
jgi:hypothetical protein